jgi:phosphoribosylaminoimidazole-succinocarboxamide synthase
MALLETNLASGAIPKRRGKVRDVYDLGDLVLLVATDRISAFDWVLPTGIPDKGRALTGLSAFWFERLRVRHHMITTAVDAAKLDDSGEIGALLEGRVMLARKARVIPFECVVRGYLSGSALKEYRACGSVCGITLKPGLVESAQLDTPIFTPATKAQTGHDENVTFEALSSAVGGEVAERLQSMSLEVYRIAAEHAAGCGLILADTKFEWGFEDQSGELMLIDEVLTPDSSRYWSSESYRPGGPQPSFDKQFVRDWLEATGWDKASPPPELPAEVVNQTRAKYVEAFERLTGQAFRWK